MRWLVLGWLVGMTLAACSAAPQPPPAAPLPTVPVVATPIHTPTPKLRVTAQPIEAAVDALKSALRQNNPQAMLSLLSSDILLEGTTSQMLNRDAAFHWLAARWQADKVRELMTTDYVEHFVLLEVKTTGWARIAGATSEALIFNLHRYDDNGKGDALNGRWRIDAIFFR